MVKSHGRYPSLLNVPHVVVAKDAEHANCFDPFILAAEKLVRENLDDDTNRRLVRDYIAEME